MRCAVAVSRDFDSHRADVVAISSAVIQYGLNQHFSEEDCNRSRRIPSGCFHTVDLRFLQKCCDENNLFFVKKRHRKLMVHNSVIDIRQEKKSLVTKTDVSRS